MDEQKFFEIVSEAWKDYDPSREIVAIQDISAQVSTNHVYKVSLPRREFVIAKVSFYGKFEHFVEDHQIINSLSNNLPFPYENFLSRAFMKGTKIYVYRYLESGLDIWVIFYRPIKVRSRLPKRLEEAQIIRLGQSFASFHEASHRIRNTLPPSSKTMQYDITELILKIRSSDQPIFGSADDLILQHADEFLSVMNSPEVAALDRIPVFVDWNIGNFSTTPSLRLYSRWDYDWFRVSTRMLDFYFFSRIVSSVGDRTFFHYLIDPLMEDRFLLFLKSYHQVNPLREIEILLLKEIYRFFILNYVIKDGHYFFKEHYATRLQQEAIEKYLSSVQDFVADKLLTVLKP